MKLDGDTRGGSLNDCSVVDKPIKFIGTSEKMITWMYFIQTVWRIVFWEWRCYLFAERTTAV